MRFEVEGALQRVRSCCGHTSGEHVARFADPVRGTGLSHYCTRCGTTCDGAATMARGAGMVSPWGMLSAFVKPVNGTASPPRGPTHGAESRQPAVKRRSPFDDLIADLAGGSVGMTSARPVHRDVFDQLTEGLRPDAVRMASQTRAELAPATWDEEDVAIVIIDEGGGVRRIPRSPLGRLADELLEASKPTPTLLTREQAREITAELDRRRAQRQHQRRLAEIRAAVLQAGEFESIAEALESAAH